MKHVSLQNETTVYPRHYISFAFKFAFEFNFTAVIGS